MPQDRKDVATIRTAWAATAAGLLAPVLGAPLLECWTGALGGALMATSWELKPVFEGARADDEWWRTRIEGYLLCARVGMYNGALMIGVAAICAANEHERCGNLLRWLAGSGTVHIMLLRAFAWVGRARLAAAGTTTGWFEGTVLIGAGGILTMLVIEAMTR